MPPPLARGPEAAWAAVVRLLLLRGGVEPNPGPQDAGRVLMAALLDPAPPLIVALLAAAAAPACWPPTAPPWDDALRAVSAEGRVMALREPLATCGVSMGDVDVVLRDEDGRWVPAWLEPLCVAAPVALLPHHGGADTGGPGQTHHTPGGDPRPALQPPRGGPEAEGAAAGPSAATGGSQAGGADPQPGLAPSKAHHAERPSPAQGAAEGAGRNRDWERGACGWTGARAAARGPSNCSPAAHDVQRRGASASGGADAAIRARLRGRSWWRPPSRCCTSGGRGLLPVSSGARPNASRGAHSVPIAGHPACSRPGRWSERAKPRPA